LAQPTTDVKDSPIVLDAQLGVEQCGYDSTSTLEPPVTRIELGELMMQ
jgi:hypothetical protein